MGSVIKLSDRLNSEVLAANASRRIRNIMSADSLESMKVEACRRLREGQEIDAVIDDLGITESDMFDVDGMPTEFMDSCDIAMFHASLDRLVEIGVEGVLMLINRPWTDGTKFKDALRVHLANVVKSTAETVEMYDLPEEDLPPSFDASLPTGEHGDEPA